MNSINLQQVPLPRSVYNNISAATEMKLEHKLSTARVHLAAYIKYLPFADGQNYTNDKRRIAELKQEIAALEIELEKQSMREGIEFSAGVTAEASDAP